MAENTAMRTLQQLVYYVLSCVIIGFPNPVAAQEMPVAKYPQGYFQWPLELQPALVANFGELRPNHFHMGLDCRTDQHVNQRVLAAADGYIAKIKIEPFGFGRCIYINHPNGLTTLYAHLNDFNPELEKWVTDQQYNLKSWKVFLDVPPALFPVKKGQFIAFSGNTGGSQGPHLHFEIRDTKSEKVLNPLLFGLPIQDDIAPDILRLAVYDRSLSVFEQSPKIYALKKINGSYSTVPALILHNSDRVSFAITSYDRYTSSTNQNGIFEALLFNDGKAVTGFKMDSISYDETRYLNAHIDYKLRSNGGSFVQHLSQLPGYPTGIYHRFSGDGVVSLSDNQVHQIRIDVTDAAGNTSALQFSVQHSAAVSKKANETLSGSQKEFYPNEINVFESGNISFYLPANSLYDTIHFQFRELPAVDGNIIYQLHNPEVPVQGYFPIKIKANFPATLSDKIVMKRYWNAKTDFAKAVALTGFNEMGRYKASFREFGNFQLLIDTIPPTIVAIGFREGMNLGKQHQLAFVVADNSEEIRNFSASLDGNWIRCSNDKGKTFLCALDGRCGPGAHELTIMAEDLVGNKTEKIYHFTR